MWLKKLPSDTQFNDLLLCDITGTGKTYRFRVHNAGIKTCLNFRIQSHNLLLVETEGTYTVAQNYTNLDICVGQSYSFLITMDQNASSDYYIVASARFVNESVWSRVTGVAILHYSNSKGRAHGPLPDPPQDFYDKTFSMNQARSIRLVNQSQNIMINGPLRHDLLVRVWVGLWQLEAKAFA